MSFSPALNSWFFLSVCFIFVTFSVLKNTPLKVCSHKDNMSISWSRVSVQCHRPSFSKTDCCQPVEKPAQFHNNSVAYSLKSILAGACDANLTDLMPEDCGGVLLLDGAETGSFPSLRVSQGVCGLCSCWDKPSMPSVEPRPMPAPLGRRNAVHPAQTWYLDQLQDR